MKMSTVTFTFINPTKIWNVVIRYINRENRKIQYSNKCMHKTVQ